MNEHTVLEKIAPTVEEAIAEGLSELGMSPEAVDVEILDSGSRGIFGVGSRQARIRLTVKMTPSAEEKDEITTQEKKAGKISVLEDEEDFEEEEIPEAAFNVLDDNLLFISRRTVVDLLEKMKFHAQVEVRYGEADEDGQKPVLVDIRGENMGGLIGRRAGVLNALQFVVNLIVSKQVEHWSQVVIDIQGYRARRERQLRQMARRMADQVTISGRRQVLEPMPASDRRIIHLELRNHPKVTTQSIGEEPVRKVTIIPKV
jgi:spoIIIJ-associated protein